MTVNPRAIAVLGVGYVALTLATLGLIVPTNTAGVGAVDAVQIVVEKSTAQAVAQPASTSAVLCKASVSVEYQGASVRAESVDKGIDAIVRAKAISALQNGSDAIVETTRTVVVTERIRGEVTREQHLPRRCRQTQIQHHAVRFGSGRFGRNIAHYSTP